MKKPLILLVDDDRAVLEALEAEVSARFGEVARIESFDRGDLALSMVALWAAEQRPIALVVADERIPGMTGTEFLTRLRKTVPGRGARAVLLTGYAGLDSALDALHRARVDRYVTKPWDAGPSANMLASLLAAWAADSGGHVVFREAVTEEDRSGLDAVLRRIARMRPGVAPEESSEGDARHLAIEAVHEDRREMVGGLRIAAGELRGFAVDPERSRLVIWTWVIDSVLAFAAEAVLDRLLVACSGRHGRFYEHLGFGVAPGNRMLQAVVSPPPPEPRPRIAMLRARLHAKGFTCCCDSYPECAGAPYATGGFGPVDLFCPVRASELG